MNTIPRFSIIVPIYKAENNIKKCIEGILAQTIADFELILVNDGSPDRSGEICEEFARKDNRIKVFHKENGGPSSARNVGLDNAIGEFICFVDVDDTVDCCFLENFGKCESDITIQGLYIKGYNEQKERYRPIYESVFSFADIKTLINILHEAENTGYIYTRIYRRQIIEDNKLRLNEEYRLREDEEFIWRYMCLCKTFSTIDKGSYHYEMPNFSSKYSNIDLDSDFECTISIIQNCTLLLGEYCHPHVVNNINRLAAIVLNSYRRDDFDYSKTNKYITAFRQYYKIVNKCKTINTKSKIIYNLIGSHTPKQFHRVLNIVLSKL